MKFDITQRLAEVDECIARTENPRHLAILNNYVRHANLEVCGLWHGIVAPDMMVEHPIYRFHSPQGLRVIEGMQAVRDEYQGYVDLQNTVIYHTDGHVTVKDDGFMTEYVTHRFWPGWLLRKMGDDIDDPEAFYIVTNTQMMWWPYDDLGRLREERVYRGADRSLRKAHPDEVITIEEAREKLLPITPPVWTIGQPKPDWTPGTIAPYPTE
ncbi:hypothetical protein [Microvirga zambiensis]|uniref:hypothetical protein n=1 Tax=Microvirga zambiensis TaxID=1402137 RepID=UPI00191F3CB0|nr:hypothetical protein [Microvirga zambiensis]